MTFIRYQFGKKDMDIIEHYSDTYTDESYSEALEVIGHVRHTIEELATASLFEKDTAIEIYTELQLHQEDGDIEVLEQRSIAYNEGLQTWSLA